MTQKKGLAAIGAGRWVFFLQKHFLQKKPPTTTSRLNLLRTGADRHQNDISIKNCFEISPWAHMLAFLWALVRTWA
jgi:hypothetical protein